MTAQNLGVVFAPSFIHREEPEEAMANGKTDPVFIELLLKHWAAPVGSPAWKAQRSERIQLMVTNEHGGDYLAAAITVFKGAKAEEKEPILLAE